MMMVMGWWVDGDGGDDGGVNVWLGEVAKEESPTGGSDDGDEWCCFLFFIILKK